MQELHESGESRMRLSLSGLDILIRTTKLFSKRERAKLLFLAFSQAALSILDLIGVGLVGAIGALTVSGVQSANPGGRVAQILRMLQLEKYTVQQQVAALALSAAFFMVLRTIASVILNRKTLRFLSYKSAHLSDVLLATELSKPLIELNEKTTQAHIYNQTSGVNALTIGILGAGSSFIADSVLLVLLFGGLMVLNVYVSLISIAFFASVAVLLHLLLQKRARTLGVVSTGLNVKANQKTKEAIELYKELFVRNRRAYYLSKISKIRKELADVNSEIAFMPSVSKYALEAASILGVLIVSGFLFKVLDAKHAIAYLAIFMAASSRIAPAVLRIQQSFLTLKFNFGIAGMTLSELEQGTFTQTEPYLEEPISASHEGFSPEISVNSISFRYDNQSEFRITELNLRINRGEVIAIVGPSGSGKSTLVDLLLGINIPNSGNILISGLEPTSAIKEWPGAIAYVAQDSKVFNGTILENLLLGYESNEIQAELISDALRLSRFDSYINSTSDGLSTILLEGGSNLSGGQKQRLNIARALITKPRLLVFDEATSALDAQTENEITNALLELKGKVTQVVIAHRLSTVLQADRVIYLSAGSIVASGTFEEVRNSVIDFDKQASLMGL